MAEEVCRLNRWDRCSLPINTLETALQLRQLDTVSFFLRSRDPQPSGTHKLTVPELPHTACLSLRVCLCAASFTVSRTVERVYNL